MGFGKEVGGDSFEANRKNSSSTRKESLESLATKDGQEPQLPQVVQPTMDAEIGDRNRSAGIAQDGGFTSEAVGSEVRQPSGGPFAMNQGSALHQQFFGTGGSVVASSSGYRTMTAGGPFYASGSQVYGGTQSHQDINIMNSQQVQGLSPNQFLRSYGGATTPGGQSRYVSSAATRSSNFFMGGSVSNTPAMLPSGSPAGISGPMRSITGATASISSAAYPRMQSRTVGMNTYVDESRVQVVGERITESEVKVPKRVTREDVVERLLVIPEKIMVEETVEETVKVREKVVEVAKVIIQEKIVEVPEIEYIEKIVEVPEIIYQEKIRHVPRIEVQERIIEIPRYHFVEKIVEVPEVEYRDVPIEKFVEVPEIVEQVVLKEVPVPQYVNKPYPEYVDVKVETEVIRNVPIPVEAVTTVDLKLPRIRPHYSKVDIPVYVPRFVEVPLPVEMLDSVALAQSEQYAEQVATLAGQTAVSLCDIEQLGSVMKNQNFESFMLTNRGYDLSAAFGQAWQSGHLRVNNAQSIQNLPSNPTLLHHVRHQPPPVVQEQVSTTTTSPIKPVVVAEVPQTSGSKTTTTITTTTTTMTTSKGNRETITSAEVVGVDKQDSLFGPPGEDHPQLPSMSDRIGLTLMGYQKNQFRPADSSEILTRNAPVADPAVPAAGMTKQSSSSVPRADVQEASASSESSSNESLDDSQDTDSEGSEE